MPKQVTKTYTLFSIDELSEKSKAKAIDNLRSSMAGDSLYSDMVTEDITETIKSLGLPTDDIRWSHSSSQGDGLALYGKVNLKEQKLIPADEVLKHLIKDEVFDITIEKVGPHMYDHSNTMKVEIGNIRGDQNLKKAEAFVEKFQEVLREKSGELFKSLTKSYDWYFEDAQILEDSRANDYVFLEDGKLANHLKED